MSPRRKLQMHPRNVFRTPPDYTDLAIKYKDFRRVCKLELTGKVSVNYRNESALRALTQVLLKEYFQLDIDFAPGSLIPTVPLRLNYVLWVEDLLNEIEQPLLRGIDIGCGSSCIYSLLAAKKNSWHMYALESNNVNITFATDNIKNNNLEEFVKIFEQKDETVIFKDFFTDVDSTMNFDFCLCNPPFYDSTTPNPFSATTRKIDKRPQPSNCRTGQMEELSCAGGEVKFVERIIEEGLQYKERITIFTSMLGHKTSVNRIISIFESKNIKNFCTTEFCQGKTTRWGVAWSYADDTVDLTKLKPITA